MSLTVAVHQPDLLPYSGVFYKLAKADLFDLRIYHQFLYTGYQRRVRMRDKWANVPTIKCPVDTSIREVKLVDPVASPRALAATIAGRYSGAPYFRTRGRELIDKINSIHTEYLWQFNLELLIYVRDLLGIRTPICVGPDSSGHKSTGIVDVLQIYGATTYLSGTGAKVYMGDCAEYTAAGIDVVWSPHKAVTGDSIVEVLLHYRDPLEIVLLAEGEG